VTTQLALPLPRARKRDPQTSREAAERVKPGNAELVYAIRWWVGLQREPKSQFDIADALHCRRWQRDTIRSAVSRSRLVEHKNACRTPGGRKCNGYSL
jgi:hypothetical protein